jgi:hypothetical protein
MWPAELRSVLRDALFLVIVQLAVLVVCHHTDDDSPVWIRFGSAYICTVGAGIVTQIPPAQEDPDAQVPVTVIPLKTVVLSLACIVFEPLVIGYEAVLTGVVVYWLTVVALKRFGVVAPLMFQVNDAWQVVLPAGIVHPEPERVALGAVHVGADWTTVPPVHVRVTPPVLPLVLVTLIAEPSGMVLYGALAHVFEPEVQVAVPPGQSLGVMVMVRTGQLVDQLPRESCTRRYTGIVPETVVERLKLDAVERTIPEVQLPTRHS